MKTLFDPALVRVFGLLILGISILAFLDLKDREMLKKVQTGELELHCEFKDGTRKINPEMVNDYYEGRWYFVNGSAVNCGVYNENQR